MTTNYLIWSLIQPSHVLLLLMTVGFVLAVARRRRAALLFFGAAFLGVLVLGVLPVGNWLAAPLENRFPEPELPPDADGIIVLAGAVEPETALDRQLPQVSSSAERLIVGAMLARKYPEAVLVHSGESPVFSVSKLAHDVYSALGVEERQMVFETRSLNTCQSAKEIAERFEDSRDGVWLLVTSAYHIPRSVACFEAHGWSVIPVPVDYLQPTAENRPLRLDLIANLDRVDTAAHEWLGLAYYRLRGWTDRFFPSP